MFENKTVFQTDELSVNDSKNLVESTEKNSLGIEYSNPNAGLTIKEVVRQPAFYVITVMFFNFGHASSVVVNYYKTFGQTFISDDSFLSIVGSVSSAFNATGRLLWGYLVDKIPYKVGKNLNILLNFNKFTFFLKGLLFNIEYSINCFSIYNLFVEINSYKRSLYDLDMRCLLYSMWNLCNNTNCYCKNVWSEIFFFRLWSRIFNKCNFFE